ncbi:MAG: hypothetical protein ACRKFN_13905, partial [Desulfitobacterium sp.]
VPFMHKIGSNNKPKIIGQFKIAESLAHQVIQRFFVFYLLKSGVLLLDKWKANWLSDRYDIVFHPQPIKE